MLTAPPTTPLRPWGPTKPRKGVDILVEALERYGVCDAFTYPDGASMEIHQAHSPAPANHLFRHEQGEAFAASSFARSLGRVGVYIATYDPGATNQVFTLAKRTLLDSVPMVTIMG
jgi:acetolactate synthase-1/2/3 large subunit